MFLKKVLIQSVICMLLIAGFYASSEIENEQIIDKRNAVIATLSEHYDVNGFIDLAEPGYGEPMDEIRPGETASVYAVAGGMVVETGENEEMGKYIKLQHKEAVSVYGNCRKLYVEEGYRVRRGQVIASFYRSDDEELYYDLVENQVQ